MPVLTPRIGSTGLKGNPFALSEASSEGALLLRDTSNANPPSDHAERFG
jgi:hypothetical protein